MRIDIQYIKDLLEIILEHDKPDFGLHHPKIKPLWKSENNVEDEAKLDVLVFHLEILRDQGIIENSTDNDSIGFRRISGGGFAVSVVPLRLTALGHQFASDLEKPGVIETIKDEFKQAGPSEAVNIALTLGKRIIEKKFEALID